jgi:hypothetical protein
MNLFGKKKKEDSMTVTGSSNTANVNVTISPLVELNNKGVKLSKRIYELAELGKFISYKDNINAWRINSSEEINQAINNLFFAKAYLGKLLGELGSPTPYQNDGKRNSIKDIEPVANSSVPNYSDFRALNIVQRIDSLRQDIQNLLDVDLLVLHNDLHGFVQRGTDLNYTEYRRQLYINQVFLHLTNAKMWLGFELGRLRDSK